MGLLGWLAPIGRELALWTGVLFLVASALSVYRGWSQRRLAGLLAETPRTDAADVRSPGTVRLRGEVVPAADTFRSPVKGEADCVLSAWEIREMYDTPKTESWEKSAWGVSAVPFSLSDATGEVLVDVEDEAVGNETGDVFTPESILAATGVATEQLRCEFETFDHHVQTDYGESPPRRVADFLETTEGVSAGPMTTDLGEYAVDESKRKYFEQTLRPGDEVSVVGHAAPRDDEAASESGPRGFVLTQTADTPLRLSVRPFDERADGRGALLFGALAGVVGVALLALRFGV